MTSTATRSTTVGRPDGDGRTGAATCGRVRGRRARWLGRIARSTGGGLLLVVGAALLVLPGPGLVLIASGLAILAVDHPWAKRLSRSVRARITAARRTPRTTTNPETTPGATAAGPAPADAGLTRGSPSTTDR